MKNLETVVVNDITYNVLAEEKINGKMANVCNGFYSSMLVLRRPKGSIEFWAMRDESGNITLN